MVEYINDPPLASTVNLFLGRALLFNVGNVLW